MVEAKVRCSMVANFIILIVFCCTSVRVAAMRAEETNVHGSKVSVSFNESREEALPPPPIGRNYMLKNAHYNLCIDFETFSRNTYSHAAIGLLSGQALLKQCSGSKPEQQFSIHKDEHQRGIQDQRKEGYYPNIARYIGPQCLDFTIEGEKGYYDKMDVLHWWCGFGDYKYYNRDTQHWKVIYRNDIEVIIQSDYEEYNFMCVSAGSSPDNSLKLVKCPGKDGVLDPAAADEKMIWKLGHVW